MPPLRERFEDIPLLIVHFCQRAEREIIVADEAMELLCAYEWPGNVRELESVIRQILTFSGRFVFREDVLRHINVSSPQQQKVNLPFWSAMNSLRRDEWPTIRDLRNWYVTQAFLYSTLVRLYAQGAILRGHGKYVKLQIHHCVVERVALRFELVVCGLRFKNRAQTRTGARG